MAAEIHKLQKNGVTIYPATTTDAVVDPESKKNLTDKLKDYYSYIYELTIPYKNDKATTRLSVPLLLRKTNLILTYNINGDWYSEIYKGDYLLDSGWQQDVNWEEFYDKRLISKISKSQIDFTKLELIEEGYYSTSSIGNEAKKQQDSRFNCVLISCYAGQKFKIAGQGGASARLWATLDKDKKVIRNAEASLTDKEGIEIDINNDECYIVVNSYVVDFSYLILLDSLINTTNIFSNIVNNIKDEIKDIKPSTEITNTYTKDNLNIGHYYSLSSGVGSKVNEFPTTSQNFGCLEFIIKKGYVLSIKTIGGNDGRAYAITDSKRIIKIVADPTLNTVDNPFTYNVEEDGYCIVNCTPSTLSTFNVEAKFNINDFIDSINQKINELDKNIESNKTYARPFYNYPIPLYKDSLKVLMIGNSFAEDATRYIDDIINVSGIDPNKISIYILSQGSGSLEDWYNNYMSDKSFIITKRAGLLEVGKTTGTVKEVISQDWDIISLQQVSTLTIDYDSFNPYLNELVRIIRLHCTNQKVTIAWHSVWGFWSGYGGAPYGIERYNKIQEATIKQINQNGIDLIIPTGTAIQNARSTSLNSEHDLTRDGKHIQYGVGAYIIACTLFQSIISPVFNKNIIGNESIHNVTEEEKNDAGVTYHDYEDVTESNRELCQKCAYYSTVNMFNITNIIE